MRSKGELIKKQKLTILVIVAVIFALIFLGGSQALSKRPPWKPNYTAVVEGDIYGAGEVKMQSGRVSSGPGDTFTLYFDGIDGFEGPYTGWLDINIDRRHSRGSFYYSWTQDEVDYSLSGWGSFEYNKKEKWFIFISVGDYELIEWDDYPSSTVWEGKLNFEIYGAPLPE